MRRNVRSHALRLVGILVAVGVGFAGGWVARPDPKQVPRPAILADAVESLEDVERRSGAVVEILDDMSAGRISRDSDALRTLRDSMQELTEALGDVNSQLRLLFGR